MSLKFLLMDPNQNSIPWWLVTESHTEGHLVDPDRVGHLLGSVLCLRILFVATLFSEASARSSTQRKDGTLMDFPGLAIPHPDEVPSDHRDESLL